MEGGAMTHDFWMGFACGGVAMAVFGFVTWIAIGAWRQRRYERAITRIGSPGDGDV
jgi:hypothetical protein